MKKITFLILSVFMTLGAWAAAPQTKYVAGEAQTPVAGTDYLLQTGGYLLTSGGAMSSIAEGRAFFWQLEEAGDGNYYVKNDNGYLADFTETQMGQISNDSMDPFDIYSYAGFNASLTSDKSAAMKLTVAAVDGGYTIARSEQIGENTMYFGGPGQGQGPQFGVQQYGAETWTFCTAVEYVAPYRSGWTITACNTCPSGYEGANDGHINAAIDESLTTFYHSDWTGSQPGKTGLQAFLVDMGEVHNDIIGINYMGRHNSTSGHVKTCRVYAFNELPSAIPANLANIEDKENNLSAAVLGEATMSNTTAWTYASNTDVKSLWCTPASGRYILFIQDSGSDAWLTCTDFNVVFGTEEEALKHINDALLRPTYNEAKTAAQTAYNSVKGISENLIYSGSQLSSPYSASGTEGVLSSMIDGDKSTYWHSDWSAAPGNGVHYVQISDIPAGEIQMTYTRRNNTYDQLTSATIQGVNGEAVTDIAVVEFPWSAAGETLKAYFTLSENYEAIRVVEKTTQNASLTGIFHVAELQFNKVDYFRDQAPTEAAALKELIDAAPEYVSQKDIDDLNDAKDAFIAAIPVEYTVTITGAEGSVKYGETVVANGGKLSAPVTLAASDLVATEVADYVAEIAVDNTALTVTVAYSYTYPVSLPADAPYIKVGEKAAGVVATTAADDNSHWYVMTQVRGGESPMYDNGASPIMRAASGTTVDASTVAGNEKYLVRFVETATEGVYNVQFGTGNFIQSTLTTGLYKNAGKYFVYNINSEETHIGWNLTTDGTTYGSKVDNNGAGNKIAFWESGLITTSGGNNDWSIYDVEFVTEDAAKENFLPTFATIQGYEPFVIAEDETVVKADEVGSIESLNAAINAVNSIDTETATLAELKACYNTNAATIKSMKAYGKGLTNIVIELQPGYNTTYLPCWGFKSVADVLKVYTVTGLETDGQTLTLTEKTSGSIQYKTPAVVENLTDGVVKYHFIGWDYSERTVELTDNLLTGTFEDMDAPEGSYVMQNHDGAVGFYLVGEEVVPTVGAYHCYLQLPESAEAPKFIGFGGQATGINEAVVEAAQNGKFVENGQIVIVKNGVKYNVAGQVIK